MMLLVLFLTCLSLFGCNGATQATNPSAPETPSVVVNPGPLAPEVVTLRVVARDVNGAVVFGPVDHSAAETSLALFGLDERAVVLEIQALDGAGQQRASFVTSLEDEARVIENPALASSESQDPTVYSFAFFGCNRVSSGGASNDPSTANVGQLQADLDQLPTLSRVPSYLFFLGDLVLNEQPGSATLQQQLSAWVQLYQSYASPIPLAAITGNHEVLVQTGDSDQTELPNPATLPVWTALMAPYLRNDNGPTTAPPNLDQLTQDESRLSYTFKDGPVGFMMLNTDTFTQANVNAQIPLNWIGQELDVLQADPAVQHIFVMGHRPIQSPSSGDEPIQPDQGAQLLALLKSHSKVRAYLCAHAHLWEYRSLDGFPQIIAGNAGSKLEKDYRKKKSAHYGFSLVHIKQSGEVEIEDYGRPVPEPYDAPPPQPQATLREQFKL